MAKNTFTPTNLSSKKIGDILNIFTDLLCSNHGSNDLREDIVCNNGHTIIPAFDKQLFTSRIIFQMINRPFSKMVIREQIEQTIVLETTNIDMMFMALKYFNAYVEDTIRIDIDGDFREGFCWKNPSDSKAYTVVLE